jgi:hypothetical protein
LPTEDDYWKSRRAPWTAGPTPGTDGSSWLSLDDDDLLFRIEALPPDHAADDRLEEIVRSTRHFFIRQEAAKRIHDRERLKDQAGDRHIGQILVRTMNRREDVAYLRHLVRESRHIEVKKAAEAQLKLLKAPAEEREEPEEPDEPQEPQD